MHATFHARNARTAAPKLFPTAGLRFRRADPLMQDVPTRTKFSNFPPKSKDQTYTPFDIRTNENNINPTDKMNVVLTLIGLPQRANRELLEVYSNPKQDRFQDLLAAICPNFLHTNLTK